MLALAGVTAIDCRVAAVTVSVAGSLVTPSSVAVMVAVPALTPVATPVAAMVATAGSPEAQLHLPR